MNSNGEYDYCPIFDNGAGLLSDTSMDYPLDGNVLDMIDDVSAKSICDSFEEQLELSEKLYGNNISFSFTKKDVEEIIFQQMRKYQYLM